MNLSLSYHHINYEWVEWTCTLELLDVWRNECPGLCMFCVSALWGSDVLLVRSHDGLFLWIEALVTVLPPWGAILLYVTASGINTVLKCICLDVCVWGTKNVKCWPLALLQQRATWRKRKRSHDMSLSSVNLVLTLLVTLMTMSI